MKSSTGVAAATLPFALAALLLAGSIGHAQAPSAATPPPAAKETEAASPPANPVDTLNDAALDQIVPLLRENYIDPKAVEDPALKRATIQGLLSRLAPGAVLLAATPDETKVASIFRSEILDQRIGYVRLGSITANNIGELDAALQKFNEAALPAIVLDLRATPPGSDFEQTAEVCRRFCPKGRVLFSVKKPNIKQEQILTSKGDPKFRGIIVALVDHNTSGDPEVIAAVLRAHVNTLVIGQQTRGEAVEYSDFPLPGGALLRIAVAEVALPENGSVFPGGVTPDLPVEITQEATDEVLKQELEKGVSEFVFETERPKMNEAALMAGTNPELDALQNAQKNRGNRKAPLRDEVLQRAVDFITTLSIYEKADRKPGRK